MAALTIEWVRDRIAKLQGWKRLSTDPAVEPKWAYRGLWYKGNGEQSTTHPIPTTLDGIAAMMPEGWKWERFQLPDGNMILEATRFSDGHKVNRLEGFDKGVRLTVEDFTCLLLAILESERSTK